jgi:portal protein
MGWIAAAAQLAREALGMPRPITLDLQPVHRFDSAPQPIDRLIAAMRMDTGPVSREEALNVAAVQRGRNELCSIGTLPLRLFRGLDVVDSPAFRQFDPNVPNIVHMAMTVEDLVFDQVAYWQVTGKDFEGYPVAFRRHAPVNVSLKRPGGTAQPGDYRWVWVRPEGQRDWQQIPASELVRFDSPNPGILKANSRAIRRALALDRVAAMYADNPQLREWFTDADTGEDGMSDDDIDAFLADYGQARRNAPYGWIPREVTRADVSAPSPRDLTLVELQKQVTIEIANGLGVDPEDLGVSTTSRTYQNAVDRKQDKINRVYAPYMRAITDRLTMGDVTRRGYSVQFDLTDYLKSDPVTQAAYWKALQDMGVTDAAEVRGWAGLSGRPPAAAPAPAVLPVAAAARPPIQLGDITPERRSFADDRPGFTFHAADFAAPPPAPTVDTANRTITGLAVPYNATAVKYGLKLQFMPGSLEYSEPGRMAHLKDHQTPVGFHRSVTDSPAGPVVELAVLDGPVDPDGTPSPAKRERDQLLYDAERGLYSGLSVGVDFSMDPEAGDVEYDEETQTYRVVRATWRETSTTYMPAFDDARVTKVAASRSGGTMPKCPHCAHEHAGNIACATFRAQLLGTPATQPAPAPAPAPVPAPVPAPGAPPAPDQAATFAQFQAFLANSQAGQQPQQNGPTLVDPHQGPAQVNEPQPYRFDRAGNLRPGTHDFSADLAAGWSLDGGDPAARKRAEGWLKRCFQMKEFGTADEAGAQFAITPANVAALNYPQNRPEMYVDQMEYQYPLWTAVNKGTLANQTPFLLPKFATSSGLVADHVSGTEPTPGAMTATNQTITPTALSGKVEVLRETWDQGGNPQASALIWRQMIRAYYEGLEAYVVAQLVANAASIPDITITTAAADTALDQAIADGLVPLQYIRGGDRFETVFTQVDLYKAMVKAKDTAGRRLYPSINPQNAVGQATRGYTALDAHGKMWLPAWALAASGSIAASSFMFDPEKVCAWASAPERIDLQWRVAWVDIGVWGYKAFAITDFAGTRELVYDPV